MHILFISHFFPPEEPPAAFLAYEFSKAVCEAGYDVSVLTGYPNWPTGISVPGYSSRRMTAESIDGISVYRLPFFAAPTGGFVRRALDFTSFQLLVKWYGRKLKRPDLIYVLVPPNEDGNAARHLARYFKCPYVLNVQDIHPDTAINLGFVKNRVLIGLLKKQEKTMYRDAAHVVAIGDRMREQLIDKGIASDRISVLSNWIDTSCIVPSDRVNSLRQEWKIDNDVFVVLYAGTFGRIHGTSIFLDIAEQLRDVNILILLVGQGYEFNKIAKKASTMGHKNILVKPFVPRSRLSELQALSDISMVMTKSGYGLTSVPSKVLGYMAASRPILAAVDAQSDTAKLIISANAGMVVQPENVPEMVSALAKLKNQPDKLRVWGASAREYAKKNLSPEVILARGVNLLEEIIQNANKI